MKWYNGFYSIREYLDDDPNEEERDYDSYEIGVQVQAEDKVEARIKMDEEIADYFESCEYGYKAMWGGFCNDAFFDAYCMDVI